MRFLWSFMILTLRQPGVAARSILLRQWPNEAIWTGLFLAVILNALFFGVLGLILPDSSELTMFDMSPESPGLSLMVSALRSVLFATMLTLGGRWLGGTGHFMPILSLLVWDQLLQLALMSVAIVVMLIGFGAAASCRALVSPPRLIATSGGGAGGAITLASTSDCMIAPS